MGTSHPISLGNNNHAVTANPNATGAPYANIAARDADTDFQIAANIDKVVKITSPLSIYMLAAVGPAVWLEFTNTASISFDQLSDTPADKSGGVNNGVVQLNAAKTALEYGQNLTATGTPTFAQLTVDNIRIDGNTITSQDTNGEIRIDPNGTGPTLINSQVSIGSLVAPAADASLDLQATDKAFIGNRGTTVQRDALTPVQFMMWGNTDTGNNEFYNGTAWASIGKIIGGLGASDNALLRSDGAGGLTAQGSTIILDDAGNISGFRQLTTADGVGCFVTIGSVDNVNEGGMTVYKGAASFDDWSQDLFQNNMRFTTTSTNTNLASFSNFGSGTMSLDVEGNITLGGTVDGVDIALEETLTEKIANKGAANGYAPLDASSKVPVTNLPASAQTGSEYKGIYNATTNTPTLIDGTGTNGDFHRVSVAGTQDFGAGNITFDIGDLVLYDGTLTLWQKVDGSPDLVQSVNGFQGVVVLTSTNIAEGTNLYYTEPRVTANTNVAANTTHRTSDGSDHTFLNQSVTTTSSPSFVKVTAVTTADFAGVFQVTTPVLGKILFVRNNTAGGNGCFVNYDINGIGNWSVGIKAAVNSFQWIEGSTERMLLAANGDLVTTGNITLASGKTVDGIDIGVAVPLNTTHRTSDGTDHTFIDQDLRVAADVEFRQITSTGGTGFNLILGPNDGTNEGAEVLWQGAGSHINWRQCRQMNDMQFRVDLATDVSLKLINQLAGAINLDLDGNIIMAAGKTVDGIDVGTAVPLNTTHRTSDGSDHSFLDQSVTITSSPVFISPALNANGNGTCLFLNAVDGANEGGQVTFVGAGSNQNWDIDLVGTGMRIFTNAATTTQLSISNFGAGNANLNVDGNILLSGTVDSVDVGVDVPLNTTHRTSDGSDHTFINQSVVSTAFPVFVGVNCTATGNGPSGIFRSADPATHILEVENTVAAGAFGCKIRYLNQSVALWYGGLKDGSNTFQWLEGVVERLSIDGVTGNLHPGGDVVMRIIVAPMTRGRAPFATAQEQGA